jgi:hypothetical protein
MTDEAMSPLQFPADRMPDRKPLTSLITLTGFDDMTGRSQAIGG